jgi:nitroreductase
MDFFKLIEERHSMRKYQFKPVEEEKLTRILEAANRAPSAGNLQGYEIYVVRKLEYRQALVKAAYDQEFLAEAPVVLVFCADAPRSAAKYGERGATLYSVQDATIACAYAQLAAKSLGLDTVWVGAFDEQAVAGIVHIEDGLRPIIMLPVGYAGKESRPRPRRPLKDLIREVK